MARDAAAASLDALLSQIGESSFDDDVRDYLIAVLEDLETADIEDVGELLRGASPAFAALGDEQATALVLRLFDDVVAAGNASDPAAAAAAATRRTRRRSSASRASTP